MTYLTFSGQYAAGDDSASDDAADDDIGDDAYDLGFPLRNTASQS